MEGTLEQHIQKVESLIGRVRASTDAEARDAALKLVQTVMDFHACAVDRMMEIAADSGDPGWAVIDNYGRDPLVSSLLLLHGLHPLDTSERVRAALEKVRPYLNSHGGDVRLIEAAGDTVRLELIGSCNGCPSSSLTLKTAVERSIFEAAPEVTSIQCEGDRHGASSRVSVSGAA